MQLAVELGGDGVALYAVVVDKSVATLGLPPAEEGIESCAEAHLEAAQRRPLGLCPVLEPLPKAETEVDVGALLHSAVCGVIVLAEARGVEREAAVLGRL